MLTGCHPGPENDFTEQTVLSITAKNVIHHGPEQSFQS